jgi:hypothetical protein
MAESTSRVEILDLLARGKIGVDEAARMLREATDAGSAKAADAEPIKETVKPNGEGRDEVADEVILIEEEADGSSMVAKAAEVEPAVGAEEPRWLRIRVSNLETGKDKVLVNIPFGMVRFGLNVARWFASDLKNADLSGFEDVMTGARRGVLVDVHDEESNEQVEIYVE